MSVEVRSQSIFTFSEARSENFASSPIITGPYTMASRRSGRESRPVTLSSSMSLGRRASRIASVRFWTAASGESAPFTESKSAS